MVVAVISGGCIANSPTIFEITLTLPSARPPPFFLVRNFDFQTTTRPRIFAILSVPNLRVYAWRMYSVRFFT